MAVLVLSHRIAAGRYRTVLVDTAPSGHTLRLLALPPAMRQWLDLLDTLLAKHRYMKAVFQGSYAPDALDRFILDLARALHTAGIATPELIINRLYPDHPCPTCRAVRAEQLECLARYASAL